MRDRCRRILFVISVLGLSWLGMMATHEVGHVVVAKLTGGKVVRVVLHPATISRTDVSPNPSPLVVAWAGPILGCLIPVLSALAVRWMRNHRVRAATKREHAFDDIVHDHVAPGLHRGLVEFFAGFCCLANGAYLGAGVFDRIGDAGEILKGGTPAGMLIALGLVFSGFGLAMWHRLGSPLAVLQGRNHLEPWLVRGLTATLLLIIVVECIFSPI